MSASKGATNPGPAPTRAVVVPGVRLTFPTGRVLVLGDERQANTLDVRKVGTRWRLGLTALARVTEADTMHQKKPRYHGCVFIRPNTASAASRRPWHAILDAELLLLEGHSTGTSLKVRWAPGAIDAGNPSGSAPAIEPEIAGTCWILEGGAHLTIGVIPRNFLDTLRENESTSSDVLGARIDDAIEGVRTMVNELISLDASGVDRPDTTLHQRTPSFTTRLDTRARMEDAVQRLHRLNQLLREGQVLDAWEALLADPVVLLRAEHPSRPLARARHPVLHGSRGPWSLADGWSPDNEVGRVRDRQVLRTNDTPPNRLAVQLAIRVSMEVRQLDNDLVAHAATKKGDAFGKHAYSELVADLLHRTTAVERAPAFAEVSRSAPVAFDSPSLQLNRRCQPLLRAWTRLDRGLRSGLDIPADEAVLRPLEKTHVLYERWCAVRLKQLLTEVLGSIPIGARTDNVVRYDWENLTSGARVMLAATMVPGPATGEHGEEQEQTNARERWPERNLVIATHAFVRHPDGLLAVQPKGENRWWVMVWDAKYRRIQNNAYLAGATYQAHAFRDALRVRIDDAAWAVQPSWSVVLHPTRGDAANVLHAWTDQGAQAPDEETFTDNGIGVVSCRPRAGEAPEPLGGALKRVVQMIKVFAGVASTIG
jgi:hypothetical protein